MVKRIRITEQMLGDGKKRIADVEKQNISIARRSIVAVRDLPANTVLAWQHLDWVRPAEGLPPGTENLLIGKRLTHAVIAGDVIDPKDVL